MNFHDARDHRSAGKLIGVISRAAQIYFQDKFKAYNIGHGQIRTLLFLARHDGMTQNDVASHFNMDKSSITSQIKILEENGFIERKRSENDGRVLLLNITKKTKENLKDIKDIHEQWTDILLEGFSQEEQDQMFEFLERMKNNATNEVYEIKDLRRHHGGGCCKHKEGKVRDE